MNRSDSKQDEHNARPTSTMGRGKGLLKERQHQGHDALFNPSKKLSFRSLDLMDASMGSSSHFDFDESSATCTAVDPEDIDFPSNFPSLTKSRKIPSAVRTVGDSSTGDEETLRAKISNGLASACGVLRASFTGSTTSQVHQGQHDTTRSPELEEGEVNDLKDQLNRLLEQEEKLIEKFLQEDGPLDISCDYTRNPQLGRRESTDSLIIAHRRFDGIRATDEELESCLDLLALCEGRESTC